jgi:hypothetical protein
MEVRAGSPVKDRRVYPVSEKLELQRLGAHPQPNSGRGKHNKGDGILDDRWIVDVKEYEKSYGLSITSWAKICTDAAKSNKEPLLAVTLGPEGGQRVRLVVISQQEFLELKEKAAAADEMREAVMDREWTRHE